MFERLTQTDEVFVNDAAAQGRAFQPLSFDSDRFNRILQEILANRQSFTFC